MVPDSEPETLNDTGLMILDWNGDGHHDITDPVASLNWQFGEGAGHFRGGDCLEFFDTVCRATCAP